MSIRTYQQSSDGIADEFVEILARTVLHHIPDHFDALLVTVRPVGCCPCGGPQIDLIFKRSNRTTQLLICPTMLGQPGIETAQHLAAYAGQHGDSLLAMKGA